MTSTEVEARPGPAPELDAQAIGVYCYLVQQGTLGSLHTAAADLGVDVHEVGAAAAHLIDLGLLRVDGDRLAPVDPRVASALLISPIEREIFARRDFVDRLRDRLDHLDRAVRPEPRPAELPVGSIDRLVGPAEIRGLLRLTSDVCRKEVLVLRADQDPGDPLDGFLGSCTGLLDRGVVVRALCPHRSRADFATRARTVRLIEDGVTVRTVSQLAHTAVVFDRSLAVLFGRTDQGEVTAWRVREDNVVRFLVELVDQLWDDAVPFAADEPGYAEVADDLQQDIARLMAQGLTDDAIARRLGMSVRTCRRHIAALMRTLDSASRFQAGVQAARRLMIEGA